MAALLGARDPAQPLLTLLQGPARVELSGSTTANWVAKTANLLVDGHDAPRRVGICLPLHWQSVCLLLGAAATGATVVVASTAAELGGCQVCFTTPAGADGALRAGADDVLVMSGHPMGAPVAGLPAAVLDVAREIPGYGDHFSPAGPPGGFEVAGRPVTATGSGLTGTDRVLTVLGLTGGLEVLLAALTAGAALVLVPDPAGLDLVAVVAAEQVTAVAGLDLAGLPRLA